MNDQFFRGEGGGQIKSKCFRWAKGRPGGGGRPAGYVADFVSSGENLAVREKYPRVSKDHFLALIDTLEFFPLNMIIFKQILGVNVK